jgi:hypothetical protein
MVLEYNVMSKRTVPLVQYHGMVPVLVATLFGIPWECYVTTVRSMVRTRVRTNMVTWYTYQWVPMVCHTWYTVPLALTSTIPTMVWYHGTPYHGMVHVYHVMVP